MPESVTFLTGSISNRSVYSIYGLDYVSQQDIIPYSSSEKQPIFHGKINYILFTILKLIK
jgi:polymerase delta-interacting protein 2